MKHISFFFFTLVKKVRDPGKLSNLPKWQYGSRIWTLWSEFQRLEFWTHTQPTGHRITFILNLLSSVFLNYLTSYNSVSFFIDLTPKGFRLWVTTSRSLGSEHKGPPRGTHRLLMTRQTHGSLLESVRAGQDSSHLTFLLPWLGKHLKMVHTFWVQEKKNNSYSQIFNRYLFMN